MSNTFNLYKFPKAEKLCSKRIIEAIYDRGNKVKLYPFILNYLEVEGETTIAFPIQIATAVPKRKVKLAVKRNRLKRQIREAYRLNKQALIQKVQNQDLKLALFLVYIGNEKESYNFIEKKLILLLDSLIRKINEKDSNEN